MHTADASAALAKKFEKKKKKQTSVALAEMSGKRHRTPHNGSETRPAIALRWAS